MRFLIRWYERGSVHHLNSFEPDGSPIWSETLDAIADYPDDEPAARRALTACRNFHGRDEEILLVRVSRVKRMSPQVSDLTSKERPAK